MILARADIGGHDVACLASLLPRFNSDLGLVANEIGRGLVEHGVLDRRIVRLPAPQKTNADRPEVDGAPCADVGQGWKCKLRAVSVEGAGEHAGSDCLENV